MINNALNNDNLPILIEHITQWHKDRNLIEGTTSQKQFEKAYEELIEVLAALHPNRDAEWLMLYMQGLTKELYTRGRIKADPTGAGLADGIGDVNVVLINIAERENLTMTDCFAHAYHDIKDRKGRMIDGTFVKESDLPENQNATN